MKHRTALLIIALLPVVGFATNKQELSESHLWQVRYGVVGEFKTASKESREILERLCLDSNRVVADHAFSIYSRLFLELNHSVVKESLKSKVFVGHIDHGYTPEASHTSKSEFWIAELEQDPADPQNGRAIQILGLIGDAQALPALGKYRESSNAYVLQNLGIVYYRLGKPQDYEDVMLSIFELPIEQTLHYYTTTIDYLLQSHPELAKELWSELNIKITKGTDLQANWVYAHILQEQRLPRNNEPNQSE